MARDHRKLRVFHDAHEMVLKVYRLTRDFPRHEWYALRLQLRKSAVSVPSNIVEGSARLTTREYVNFLNISRGSAAEANYLVDLAAELGYLSGAAFKELNDRTTAVCAQLEALLQAMTAKLAEEDAQRRARRRRRTRA